MNFARQKQVRHNIVFLALIYLLSVCSVMGTVYLTAFVLWQSLGIERETINTVKIEDVDEFLVLPNGTNVSNRRQIVQPQELNVAKTYDGLHPVIFLLTATATSLVIVGRTSFKLRSLKKGGGAIAQQLGGRLLQPSMALAVEEQQLLDLVAEMAIAAKVKVPQVYLLDADKGINAFTAGYSDKDAAIGLTRGCLDELTRAELQAVIARQISHLFDGDLRVKMHLIGFLHGLFAIYLLGRGLMDWGSHLSRQIDSPAAILLISIARIPTVVMGLVLMNLGAIAHLGGRILQCLICSETPLLADASAVELTQYPQALADVLRRFPGNSYLSLIKSPYSGEMGHLFFVDAMGASWLGNYCATHPSIEQRLKRLKTCVSKYSSNVPQPSLSPLNSPVKAGAGKASAVWLAEVPSLQMAISEPSGAIALVYALLLASEPSALNQQIELLRQIESPGVVETAINLAEDAVSIESNRRLPLLELAIGSLRKISAEEHQRLLAGLTALGQLNPSWGSEWIFYSFLRHHLDVKPEINREVDSIAAIWQDCLLLFSLLAHVVYQNPNAIAYSFRCALDKLPSAREQEFPKELPDCDFYTLSRVLDNLARSSVKLKSAIADAAFYIVTSDRKVSDLEADLLRAIAIILDRPLPPLLQRHFNS